MSAQRCTPSPAGERGIALMTTILMMVLMSALLVGFTTAVMSDQNYRAIDRDRARAFTDTVIFLDRHVRAPWHFDWGRAGVYRRGQDALGAVLIR